MKSGKLQAAKIKPVFGTREWANHNENIISGCSHDCRYCYAKSMAIRFRRKTAGTWNEETVNTVKLSKRFQKRDGRIMFPTSHDIVPENLNTCLLFLGRILGAGNEILIVSKPHIECVKTLCEKLSAYRAQILFRFTIGSADNDTLRFWDQHAPGFEERLESLAHAHRMGFATSVSCEPLLDNNADELIWRTRPHVTDAIWIGKPNKLIQKLKINGHGDHESLAKAAELMASLSDEYILDLYSRYMDDPRVKWKESIKKVIGIDIPMEAGLDI